MITIPRARPRPEARQQRAPQRRSRTVDPASLAATPSGPARGASGLPGPSVSGSVSSAFVPGLVFCSPHSQPLNSHFSHNALHMVSVPLAKSCQDAMRFKILSERIIAGIKIL